MDIEKSIIKYCKILNNYLTNVTKITRDSFKELLFLITIRDSDFMYLLEKQNVPSLEEFNGVVDYRNFLIPRRIEVDNYDINIVVDCKEKKDERGWKRNLKFYSWDNIKLT